MGVEIESYVRALGSVDPVGNWYGQGCSSIERIGAGQYRITLDDNYEIDQIDGVIQAANIDGAGTAYTFSYLMSATNTVDIFFYDENAALADPGGFSFSVRIGNVELPLTDVL